MARRKNVFKVAKQFKFYTWLILGVFFCLGSVVFASDGLTVSQQRATRVVNVKMRKIGKQFNVIKNPEVISGDFVYGTDVNEYKGIVNNGVVYSFQGAILGYYEIPGGRLSPMLCVDSFDDKNPGGCSEIDNADVIIQAPFFSNGKFVDVYSANKEKLFSIDLSSVATCNENGKCDVPKETVQECPADCGLEKSIVTSSPVTSEASSFSLKRVIIGLLLIVVIVVASFAIYRRRYR